MEEHTRCESEVDLDRPGQNGRPIGSWLCCLPCYWLKRNNSFHKASLTVATLLVTVLLVASPVIFLISSVPGEKSRDRRRQESECSRKKNEKVCLEEQCLIAANRISGSTSWKTDPCRDFYGFACGSRAKKKEVSTDAAESKFQREPSSSVNFDALQRNVDRTIQQLLTVSGNSDPFQKLRAFYKSCIRAGDGKRVSLLPMFSLLNDLGGYVIPESEPRQDLSELILSLLRLNGAPLFDVYFDDSSRMVPVIDLPPRSGFDARFRWYRTRNDSANDFPIRLPSSSRKKPEKRDFSRSFFNEARKGEPNENEARDFTKATAEEKRLLVMEKIMQEFMPENMTADAKRNETHRTLLFANLITELYPREKDIVKNYQGEANVKMNISNLQIKYAFVRWRFILEEFLNLRIDADDSISVSVPDYLDDLQKILTRFSSRIIHNGLLLIFATDTLYELVNTSSARDRPGFCARITANVFGKAVSALYVRQHGEEYLDQLRTRVARIFDNLKETFESRIRNVSWLDGKTRAAVFRKLAALRGQFLTWPNFRNASYVESLMEDVRVDPENFFGNVIRRYQQLRTMPTNFRSDRSEEKRWAYPFVANAFYIATMNTIIIPLAVLTQPYFRGDVPLYIPYSTIGLIFAREILRGFDSKGIGYDFDGKPGALLSSESRARLEARLDCFVEQFSSTFWKKVRPTLSGANAGAQFDRNETRNENMAVISGLEMAYQAWKTVTDSGNEEATLPGVGLDARQLFFLNAAQAHCSVLLSPADYIFLVEVDFRTFHPERVNGIMMNSPGFAEAYKCPPGSPMNPRKKCSAW